MFIRLDFKCQVCPDAPRKERFVKKDEVDSQVCDDCGQRMYKLPPGPVTTFRFADKNQKKRS